MLVLLIPGILIAAMIIAAIKLKGTASELMVMLILMVACGITGFVVEFWIPTDVSFSNNCIKFQPTVYRRHNTCGLVPTHQYELPKG